MTALYHLLRRYRVLSSIAYWLKQKNIENYHTRDSGQEQKLIAWESKARANTTQMG